MTLKLNLLHKELEKIAPIFGVDDRYVVDFRPDATESQRIEAQEYADNWTPPPDPDWRGFSDAIVIDFDYLRNTTFNNITLGLKTSLEQQITLEAKGSSERSQTIKSLWDAIAAQSNPTEQEIDNLNALLAQYNIDQFFTLKKPSGVMILKS